MPPQKRGKRKTKKILSDSKPTTKSHAEANTREYLTGNDYWLKYPTINDPLYKLFKENSIRRCAVNLSINSVIPILELTAYRQECILYAKDRKRLKKISRLSRMEYLYNHRLPRVEIQHIPREHLDYYVFWQKDNFKMHSNVRKLCEEKIPANKKNRIKYLHKMITAVERNLYNVQFRETSFFRRLKIIGRALKTSWSPAEKAIEVYNLANYNLLDFEDVYNHFDYTIKILPRLYFSIKNMPSYLCENNYNRSLCRSIAKYIDNSGPNKSSMAKTIVKKKPTEKRPTGRYKQNDTELKIIKSFLTVSADEQIEESEIDKRFVNAVRLNLQKRFEKCLPEINLYEQSPMDTMEEEIHDVYADHRNLLDVILIDLSDSVTNENNASAVNLDTIEAEFTPMVIKLEKNEDVHILREKLDENIITHMGNQHTDDDFESNSEMDDSYTDNTFATVIEVPLSHRKIQSQNISIYRKIIPRSLVPQYSDSSEDDDDLE